MDRRIRVSSVVAPETARRRRDDVAVLVLAEELTSQVAARLRRPEPASLLDQSWWSFGFPDGDEFGDSSHGIVDESLGYGWVRLSTQSPYPVRPGYSGAALWSAAYDAVVGLVGQANSAGNARALTLWQAVRCLPDEKLDALTDWSVDAAGEAALAAWGWSLAKDDEARRHWRPRARGVSNDAEPGFRFRGRTAALTAIADWIIARLTSREALVVTGSPGVGKSAVLGRIVTSADRDIVAALPPSDNAVRAPVGSVSCAVHAKGKTALEVADEIARAASAEVKLTEPSDLALALRVALTGYAQERGPFTVVIDALDETTSAAQARTVVQQVVRPLVEDCADLGVRVVVGTRRQDGGGDLLAYFGSAARVIDLDSPEYFEEADLAAYAQASLQLAGAERPDSPYRDPGVAGPVAERIAALADRNFLIAGLIARSHGLHDQEPVPAATIVFTPTMDAALTEYLARVPGVGGLSAAEVLTALAFAEAPGFPADLWSVGIGALYGATLTSAELRAFARSAAANFLVETSQTDAADSGSAFRLFHQALNDVLLARRERIHADEKEIALAMIAWGNAVGWRNAPVYLMRSLPGHAVRGKVVDELFATDDYPLYADLERLIPIGSATHSAVARNRAALLRMTPRAANAAPATRAALLSITEAQENLGNAYRTVQMAAPYRAVWAAITAQDEQTVLEGHTRPVHAVCPVPMPDGRTLLASGGWDGVLGLWDPVTGQSVYLLDTGYGAVQTLCTVTVPDGRVLLATGHEYGGVALWDPASGKKVSFIAENVKGISALCTIPLPDGRTAVASTGRAGRDRFIRLSDPITGQLIRLLKESSGASEICALPMPDGRTLIAGNGTEGTMRSWGYGGHRYNTWRGLVRLWDPVTGKCVRSIPLSGERVSVFAMSAISLPGGRTLLLCGTANGQVWIWDPVTGKFARKLRGNRSPIYAVSGLPEPDGRVLIAAARRDSTVQLWDPATGEAVHTLRGHLGWVGALCVVPAIAGLSTLATGSADNTVRLWSRPAGEQSTGSARERTRWVDSTCAVPISDGRTLVGVRDTEVRLRDAATGEVVYDLEQGVRRGAGLCTVAMSDGRVLVAGAGSNGLMRLWDSYSGEALYTFAQRTGWISSVCAIPNPDGRTFLASTGLYTNVRVQDPATGRTVRSRKGNGREVSALCAVPMPDGKTLIAFCGSDNKVKLSDPGGGRPVRILNLKSNSASVWSACSVKRPDGTSLLACGTTANTVEIWDPITGDSIATLAGHASGVRALCAVPARDDRIVLASGAADLTVRLWDLSTLRQVMEIPVRYGVTSLTTAAGYLVVGMTAGVMALTFPFDQIPN